MIRLFVEFFLLWVVLSITSFAVFASLSAFAEWDVAAFYVDSWSYNGRMCFGLWVLLIFVFIAKVYVEAREGK